MANKTYKCAVANSTYIDAKGMVHKFNGTGMLLTADVSLQAELEAAIKSGAHFAVGENAVAPKIPEVTQTDPAAALLALKAAGKAVTPASDTAVA